jgi:hypothetical protein
MKKIKLEESFDYQHLIIGIASDEPIFKLCWEINESLIWALKKVELDILNFSEPMDSLAQKIKPLLFDPLNFKTEPPAYYEDHDSFPRQEMALFEASIQKIPKEIRAFRYILLLRSVNAQLPESVSLIQTLNELSFVISAIDITHLKNIKQILP